MGIGHNLKKALRYKGMTIKQLSRETGISYNTLYAITKRDSKRMDSALLEKVAEHLMLPCSYFIDTSTANAKKLVRCKNCIYREHHDALLYCGNVRGLAGSVAPEDYCSLGESAHGADTPCACPKTYDAGSTIKFYREQRGLSQEKLAKAIGASATTISRYENGSRNPSIRVLALIAKALDVHMADLVGGDDNDRN